MSTQRIFQNLLKLARKIQQILIRIMSINRVKIPFYQVDCKLQITLLYWYIFDSIVLAMVMNCIEVAVISCWNTTILIKMYNKIIIKCGFCDNLLNNQAFGKCTSITVSSQLHIYTIYIYTYTFKKPRFSTKLDLYSNHSWHSLVNRGRT